MKRLILGIALLTACQEMEKLPPMEGPVPAPKQPPQVFQLTAPEATTYLTRLAPMLAGRVLNDEETGRIAQEPTTAVRAIVDAWTKAPYFKRAARDLISQKLLVSGESGGIDFDLPGNLAEYIVANNLPYAALLTADYCVDGTGNKRACDTGAPFAAGVLGTRAYLASRAGRFNLTRSSTMMLAFACSRYPMDVEMQPRVEREQLINMFQAESLAEQTEQRATSGFGNGEQCYTCHGQFAAHAQVFVRFDETGAYQANASGLQDTGSGAELGRSVDGLYASHFHDAGQAASERSQMMGTDVANLADAAKVLAQSSQFLACGARNLVEYVLAVDGSTRVDENTLYAIADAARAVAAEPTLATIAVETFSSSRIVRSIVPKEATP
ncbi:MAG: hypothetical protein ACAI38_11735 [Myxococcota bacterium]